MKKIVLVLYCLALLLMILTYSNAALDQSNPYRGNSSPFHILGWNISGLRAFVINFIFTFVIGIANFYLNENKKVRIFITMTLIASLISLFTLFTALAP